MMAISFRCGRATEATHNPEGNCQAVSRPLPRPPALKVSRSEPRPADREVLIARDHWEHHLWLAASYAAADEEALAHQAGRQAMALRPQLLIPSYVRYGFAWNRAEDKDRLRDALARAGIPE